MTRGTWWWGGPARQTSCGPSTAACRCGGGGPRRLGAAARRTLNTPGATSSGRSDCHQQQCSSQHWQHCSATPQQAQFTGHHLVTLQGTHALVLRSCFATVKCCALRPWQAALCGVPSAAAGRGAGWRRRAVRPGHAQRHPGQHLRLQVRSTSKMQHAFTAICTHIDHSGDAEWLDGHDILKQ